MNTRSKKIIKAVTVDSRMSIWLKAISARTGLSEAEQIRRGIQLWLESYDCVVGETGLAASSPGPVLDEIESGNKLYVTMVPRPVSAGAERQLTAAMRGRKYPRTHSA